MLTPSEELAFPMPQRILHDKFLRNFSSYSEMIKYVKESQGNMSTEPAETTESRIRPMNKAESGIIIQNIEEVF